MIRGRPFQPGNKFSRGRPRGSRNKEILVLQNLLDEHCPALMRKSLVLAMQGDVPLLHMFLERKLTKASDPPVKIGRLPTGTLEEVIHAHQMVIHEVAAGNLTPLQAVQIDALLETSRKLIEAQVLIKRVEALEQQAQETNNR